MQATINPYFCVLTANGVSSWISTPVTAETTADEIKALADSPLSGLVLVSNDARVVALKALGKEALPTTRDNYLFAEQDVCKKFLESWLEETCLAARKKELEDVFTDPFATWGGKLNTRTVDVETAEPADPTPVQSSGLYDLQLFWQPADDPAWEASIKIRATDVMPDFSAGLMGVGGKFLKVSILTQAGLEKMKSRLPHVPLGSPPFDWHNAAAITRLVETWNKPAKMILSWENGEAMLNPLPGDRYTKLTGEERDRFHALYQEFQSFSKLRESQDYVILPWIGILAILQSKLDKILGQ